MLETSFILLFLDFSFYECHNCTIEQRFKRCTTVENPNVAFAIIKDCFILIPASELPPMLMIMITCWFGNGQVHSSMHTCDTTFKQDSATFCAHPADLCATLPDVLLHQVVTVNQTQETRVTLRTPITRHAYKVTCGSGIGSVHGIRRYTKFRSKIWH